MKSSFKNPVIQARAFVVLVGLFLSLTGGICSNSSTEPPTPTSTPDDQKCYGALDAGKVLSNGKVITESDFSTSIGTKYKMTNNDWGRDHLPGTQCIFGSGDVSGYGWNWDWPNSDEVRKKGLYVRGFPNIGYGEDPNGVDPKPGKDNLKPIDLGTLSQFDVHYSAVSQYDGAPSESSYDLAFDIWITNTPSNSTNVNITNEVLIAEDVNNMQPDGALMTLLPELISGRTYRLYRHENIVNNGAVWTFFTFLPEIKVSASEMSNRYISIAPFIKYLELKGYLTTSLPRYLSWIGFGNEPGYGKGRTTFTSYEVIHSESNEKKGLSGRTIPIMYPLGMTVQGKGATGGQGDVDTTSDVFTDHGIRVSPGSFFDGTAYFDYGPVKQSSVVVTIEWEDNAWFSGDKELQLFNWVTNQWESFYAWSGNDGQQHTDPHTATIKPANIDPSGKVRVGVYASGEAVIHLNSITVK